MRNDEQQTVKGAVIIPFLQAGITGALVGITTGSVAWVIELQNPLALGLGIGSVVALVSWLSYRGTWEQRLEARGFARWRNPGEHKQGMELTGKGTALVRGVAENAERLLTAPSPADRYTVEAVKIA